MRFPLGLGTLASLGLLIAASPSAAIPQETEADPAPMRRHLGAWTLSMRSEVIFKSAPERPHTLGVDLAYPARGRWMLSARDPGEDRRTLIYRYGSRLWSIPFGTGTSRLAEGSKSNDMRMMFALRRALLAWPHQFEWKGEDLQRKASLGKTGSLLAQVNEEGQPIRLEVRRGDGTAYETLVNIRWEKIKKQFQPVSFDMVVDGKTIWHEKVLRVDRSLRFLDSYFMPQDQRPKAPTRPPEESRRYSAPAGLEWEQALDEKPLDAEMFARLRLAAQEALGARGGTLRPGLGLVMDEQGQVQAVLFSASMGEVSAGGAWTPAPPREGLLRPLAPGEDPDRALLRALVAQAAEGGRPARIVLWEGPEGARSVRVEVSDGRSLDPRRPLESTPEMSSK